MWGHYLYEFLVTFWAFAATMYLMDARANEKRAIENGKKLMRDLGL